VYKCLHGSAPAYLIDELCQVADVEARRRLRSSSSPSLIVSRTRLSTTIGDRAFPVAAARVWNSLPDHVTSAPSVAVFPSRLKTHLFNISYPSPCDCTVPAQWRLVTLDTLIVLACLLVCLLKPLETWHTALDKLQTDRSFAVCAYHSYMSTALTATSRWSGSRKWPFIQTVSSFGSRQRSTSACVRLTWSSSRTTNRLAPSRSVHGLTTASRSTYFTTGCLMAFITSRS